MFSSVQTINSENINFPGFTRAFRKNLALGSTMPLSTRFFVELASWRELKRIDGSLNIGHRVATSAVSAVITVVSLVESAARVVLLYLLILPLGFLEKGGERYTAFVTGTLLNVCTPVIASLAVVSFLFSSLFSTGDEVIMDGENSFVKTFDEGPVVREQVKSMRDAFRGKFYKYTINLKTNVVTYKDVD